jgi:acetyl esterase/lipase
VLDNVHGLAQSAYDIRCLLRWIATQAALSVSVTGLSLGGGVAALVAGLEPEIGAVVGLVPAVDFPEVFRRQSPRHMRRSDEFLHLHAASKTLHEVVSPLSFRPATAPAQLHILAGIHDRLLDPLSQAARLAEHWGTTNVTWVDRGHVTHMGSGGVIATLEHAITAAPNLPAGV